MCNGLVAAAPVPRLYDIAACMIRPLRMARFPSGEGSEIRFAAKRQHHWL